VLVNPRRRVTGERRNECGGESAKSDGRSVAISDGCTTDWQQKFVCFGDHDGDRDVRTAMAKYI
jgi:hypothetical protein